MRGLFAFFAVCVSVCFAASDVTKPEQQSLLDVVNKGQPAIQGRSDSFNNSSVEQIRDAVRREMAVQLKTNREQEIRDEFNRDSRMREQQQRPQLAQGPVVGQMTMPLVASTNPEQRGMNINAVPQAAVATVQQQDGLANIFGGRSLFDILQPPVQQGNLAESLIPSLQSGKMVAAQQALQQPQQQQFTHPNQQQGFPFQQGQQFPAQQPGFNGGFPNQFSGQQPIMQQPQQQPFFGGSQMAPRELSPGMMNGMGYNGNPGMGYNNLAAQPQMYPQNNGFNQLG